MNYETLLREHHLKVTPQRLSILSSMSDKGHISIEDLFASVKKKFSSISLATLYKNINAMLETALISEVKILNMKSKYEITKAKHIHMVCQSCQEVMDLELDLSAFVSKASEKSHYTVKEVDIVLSGLCEKCQ